MPETRVGARLSVRFTASTLIFVACCLLSSVREVVSVPTPGTLRNSVNEIPRRSDQRFASLKAALPEWGVVGYVGQAGRANPSEYYLVQYALAPVVVDYSPNHPLVVGNYPTLPPSRPPLADLQLVKDFGNGVLLFSNTSFHTAVTAPGNKDAK